MDSVTQGINEMSNDHTFRGKHRQHGRRPDLRPDERVSLAAFVERLRQRYGEDLLRVVLFGSKARGDFDAESDVDVLVVLRDGGHWQRLAEISDLTSQLLLESSVNISPLVCDLARYCWWAEHHAPIYNSIQRDGVELWTKRRVII
jgi:predicted nucleotidyltransferase